MATAVSYARGAPERRVAAGDRRVQAPTGSNSSCTKEWVWQHGEFLSKKNSDTPRNLSTALSGVKGPKALLFCRASSSVSLRWELDRLKKTYRTRPVAQLVSLTRERYPYGHNHPAIMIEICWWDSCISNSIHRPCVYGATPHTGPLGNLNVLSSICFAQSKIYAPNPPPPLEEKLKENYPPNYDLSRFLAFVQSNVGNATENPPHGPNVLFKRD